MVSHSPEGQKQGDTRPPGLAGAIPAEGPRGAVSFPNCQTGRCTGEMAARPGRSAGAQVPPPTPAPRSGMQQNPPRTCNAKWVNGLGRGRKALKVNGQPTTTTARSFFPAPSPQRTGGQQVGLLFPAGCRSRGSPALLPPTPDRQ